MIQEFCFPNGIRVHETKMSDSMSEEERHFYLFKYFLASYVEEAWAY